MGKKKQYACRNSFELTLKKKTVLPKSTMLGTNSVPLVALIGVSCLLQDKRLDACL